MTTAVNDLHLANKNTANFEKEALAENEEVRDPERGTHAMEEIVAENDCCGREAD